jgi:MFS transporter, PAT family, beta-lactamase induction signal transducer AmpG
MTLQQNPSASTRTPWRWIPSLYYVQGIPYVVVMTLAVVMYKNLGLDNTAIALYTSWLYLPWVIKPLWSPFVDMFRTKRFWIVSLQLLIGAALALVAFTLPMTHFFQLTLAVFWLMAFSSATHDIAADGFYMIALPHHTQAAFVGVRSTFYRLAMISGQGALVVMAGRLTTLTGNLILAWQLVFLVLAAMFFLLGAYHYFLLPKPQSDIALRVHSARDVVSNFIATLTAFFARKDILLVLAFLLTYRLGEAQALKLVAPFLLDPTEKGGLGLTTEELGWVYGTVGVAALTVGGLVGGYAISLKGLRYWLWPMLLSVHLPNIAFVALAHFQPSNVYLISTAIAVEQLGYGFGFAAYLLFMIMVADGKHKTAHYALCTGFMAMGMMLPGMISGWIQANVGYLHFFIWVCLCTIPSMLVAFFIQIDANFGKKVVAGA